MPAMNCAAVTTARPSSVRIRFSWLNRTWKTARLTPAICAVLYWSCAAAFAAGNPAGWAWLSTSQSEASDSMLVGVNPRSRHAWKVATTFLPQANESGSTCVFPSASFCSAT